MWRFSLAYGDRKKVICFDRYCNLTVKINTLSDKIDLVDEKYVLYYFSIVSPFEEHINIYDIGNLSENEWHCISHYSDTFYWINYFLSRKNTATFCSRKVPMWFVQVSFKGYHKWIKRQTWKDLPGPRATKSVWSFLFCPFGYRQKRRGTQEGWKHSDLLEVYYIQSYKSPEKCLFASLFVLDGRVQELQGEIPFIGKHDY